MNFEDTSEEYKDLVKRVEEIDKGAAEYMRTGGFIFRFFYPLYGQVSRGFYMV